MACTTYQHEPLPSLESATRTVRLLQILPGAFSDDIHVELRQQSLDSENHPPFEALSYVWGSTHASESVYVGLEKRWTLPATQNLVQAIRHLRYRDKVRTMWVDSLCIDQSNIPERNSQVLVMGDIYGKAHCVVVWFGPEENDSACALEVLQSLSSKIDFEPGTHSLIPSSSAQDDSLWADRRLPLPYNKRELDALKHFFHRTWFERLWIRQEIYFGHFKGTIYCGFSQLPWTDFWRAIVCISQHVYTAGPLGDWYSENLARLKFITTLALNQNASFLTLQRHFGSSECSDPRDRVYAVLSMLDSSERGLRLRPDYSLSKTEVYRDLVQRFIHHFRDMTILCQCPKPEPFATPTWVPDFAANQVVASQLPLLSRAGGPFAAQAIFLPDGTLRAAGIAVQTIDELIPTLLGPTMDGTDLWLELQRILQPAVAERKSHLAKPFLEILARVLTCDDLQDSRLPRLANRPTLLESVDALRKHLAMTEAELAATPLDLGAWKFCEVVASCVPGKQLFTTADGSLGLGPKTARAGDEVVVLPGCDKPLILRPYGVATTAAAPAATTVQPGKFQLVGECYLAGYMAGEALLGPLSEPYALIKRDRPTAYREYINKEDGTVQLEDPRLEALPIDLDACREVWAKDLPLKVDLPPPVLQAVGIDVEWIDIV